MIDLNEFINSLPEDKRAEMAYAIAQLPDDQKEKFMLRYKEKIVNNPNNTTKQPSAFPKNDPMGNKVVWMFGDKPVYRNSKWQNYYFTGRWGAAIIWNDKIEPVSSVAPPMTPAPKDTVEGTTPPETNGGNWAAWMWVATWLGVWLYWLNKLKQQTQQKIGAAKNNISNYTNKLLWKMDDPVAEAKKTYWILSNPWDIEKQFPAKMDALDGGYRKVMSNPPSIGKFQSEVMQKATQEWKRLQWIFKKIDKERLLKLGKEFAKRAF